MRVLFTAWAQTGHFQSLVPLGWALRAAGHEVVVATSPTFAATVAESGLTAAPVGPAYDVSAELNRRFAALSDEAKAIGTFERSTAWRPGNARPVGVRRRDLPENQLGREVMSVVTESCDTMLDETLEFARAWRPDLIVFEPMGWAGPIIGALLAIPCVRQLWSPDYTLPMQTIVHRLLGPVMDRYGLTELDITGTMTLDPCPPRMQLTDDLVRQPARYTGYHGTMVPPRWLLEPVRRPRVCITWGTTIHRVGLHRTYLAPVAVRALAGLDVDIVVAALDSQRASYGELPDNVLHFGPAPLRHLLPTCSAVIHQAGGGTTMSSVVSGVPQLLIPTMQDSMCTARQVVGTGSGLQLRSEEATESMFRETVEALVGDAAFRDAAHRLRDEAHAMPAPEEIVGILEKLA
jgi:UDP:flavonoid glycosyltransferase YjiC (YdhE family)